MCNRLQVITSLPVCAKRAVTYVRHWNNLFLGLSPWRDVMCDMLCMLGEAAVRGLIDCINKLKQTKYRFNYITYWKCDALLKTCF